MNKWDRQTGFCCRSCAFCVPNNEELGRCRRNAPTMKGFPVVYLDSDFCGDHKIGSNPLKDAYLEKSIEEMESKLKKACQTGSGMAVSLALKELQQKNPLQFECCGQQEFSGEIIDKENHFGRIMPVNDIHTSKTPYIVLDDVKNAVYSITDLVIWLRERLGEEDKC